MEDKKRVPKFFPGQILVSKNTGRPAGMILLVELDTRTEKDLGSKKWNFFFYNVFWRQRGQESVAHVVRERHSERFLQEYYFADDSLTYDDLLKT